MRITCKYSGVTFTVSNFANISLRDSIHPLFGAPVKLLLSRTTDWAADKLNADERKILFLSLLHSTELVEFRITATISESTVQLNMETLIRFIGWQSGIQHPAFILPKFIISRETADMNNVRHWLQAWWDAKKDFEEAYRTTSQLTKSRNRETALERLIKNAAKTTDDYASLLSSWAMDAGNVPKSLREYWCDLFKLRGLAIYNARTVDLEEMLEHFEEVMEHGSIYAAATMKHIRRLLARNKAGLNYGLGIPDEDLEKLDFEELALQPFTIIEDEVEQHNILSAATNAPTEEPQQKDYASKLAFLRAKAAWTLAQKAKEYGSDAFPAQEPEQQDIFNIGNAESSEGESL